MTSWMEMARARFLTKAQPATVKTDENRVLSVLTVPSTSESEADAMVLSVLSVPDVAIHENTFLFQKVMAAAMHCCDVHGDGQLARAQMQEEVMATPSELLTDLLDYFIVTYGDA